ncbi:MAG: right-handed parallel beta-helix repeat-containing protein, partial [Candidatus Pacearchaeota archaeon]
NNSEYNTIYLTALEEGYSQDIFDLKIVGGSVEFEHIIDPDYPAEGYVIYDCGVIQSPGNYQLNQTIISNSSSCMIINSSDVLLDLNGHAIQRKDNSSSAFIFNAGIRAYSYFKNITVMNGSIINFYRGIMTSYVNESNFFNLNISFYNESVGSSITQVYPISISGNRNHVQNISISDYVLTGLVINGQFVSVSGDDNYVANIIIKNNTFSSIYNLSSYSIKLISVSSLSERNVFENISAFDNVFENSSLTGIRTYTAKDNLFKEIVFSYIDPAVYSYGYSENNIFLNLSQDLNKVFVEQDSDANFGWYFQTKVEKAGEQVEGANVFALDNKGNVINEWITNSEGKTPLGYLIDYKQTNLSKEYYSDYTLYASNNGYSGEISFNATTEKNSYDSVIVISEDNSAPAISNVQVSNITHSSAIIYWDTDEPSDSNISYGLVSLSNSVYFDQLTKHHSVKLTELSIETLYYYGIKSCDLAGNCENLLFDVKNNFTTLKESEVTACRILDKENGNYELKQDIFSESDLDFCIIVSAKNVSLDCKGYKLYSQRDVSGIYSHQLNTTIKNCNLSSKGRISYQNLAIDIDRTNYFKLINSSIFGYYYGVYLNYSDYFEIKNSSFDNQDVYAIYLYSADYGKVENINLSNGNYGISLSYDSNRNNFSNIISNFTSYPFAFGYSSDYNILENSSVYSSFLGLGVSSVSYNTFRDIMITNSSGRNIDFSASSVSNCNNNFKRITEDSGKNFTFINYSVTLSDNNFSHLVLCNADSSHLDNLTISSNKLQEQGLQLFYTDYSTLKNINSSGNYYGLFVYHSHYNAFDRLIGKNTSYAQIYGGSSYGNTFKNLNMDGGTYGIYWSNIYSPFNYVYNLSIDSSSTGFYISGLGNLYFDNGQVNSTTQSFRVYNSNNTALSNITLKNFVFTNPQAEVYLDSYSEQDENILVSFLNVSYNTLFENVLRKSILYRDWYYQARVHFNGEPINNASLVVYNSSGYNIFNLTTNSQGFTNITKIRDYVNDEGLRIYSSNYVVEVTNKSLSKTHLLDVTNRSKAIGFSGLILDSINFGEDVTSCGILNIPNSVYTLKNSVISTGTCFNITGENITIDCNGWENRIIYGNQDSATKYYGIYSNKFNTTVKNCEVTSGNSALSSQTRTGIYFNNTNNSRIENVNLSNNYNGLQLELSSNNILSNIIADSNDYTGILLYPNSTKNFLLNITAENNNYGIQVGPYSSNNVFSDIIAKDNIRGISLSHSSNNNILNVSSYGASSFGIYLYYSSNNTFSSIAINSSNRGIGSDQSSNNTFSSISINSSNYGITLTSSSSNKLISISIINSTYGIEMDSASNNHLKNINISKSNRKDIYFSASSISNCNNKFENILGSGGLPVRYYNSSVTLANQKFSQLILCNADNSNLNNISIESKDGINNNGLFGYYTDNSNFSNINSSGNYYGLELISCDNNRLTNLSLSGSQYDFQDLYLSSLGRNFFISDYAINYYYINSYLDFLNKHGQVSFLSMLSVGGNYFNNRVIILNNSAYAGFASPANISLYNLPKNFENPVIYRGESVCSDCYNFTSLNAGNVTFNVSLDGRYSIREAPETYYPRIISVRALAEIMPIQGESVSVIINFTAYDMNGFNDLKDDSAKVVLSKLGYETSRESSCINTGSFNVSYTNYSCNVKMQYFDKGGDWNVFTYIEDDSGAYGANESVNFKYLYLTAVDNPAVLDWGRLSPGDVNKPAINNPVLANNTGNEDIPVIKITGANLINGTYFIGVSNFSVNTSNGYGNGVLLVNGSVVSLDNSFLASRNSYFNGEKELYFYINQVPYKLPSLDYKTDSNYPWIIGFAVLISLRRKKKNIKIPLSIFKLEVSPAEALCKYLRENKGLSVSEITRLINRNKSSVSINYKNAVKKLKERINQEDEFFVDINIFSNRKLSILENVIKYLKEKGFRNIEIANLLNKDQRNISTLYSRVQKKLEGRLEVKQKLLIPVTVFKQEVSPAEALFRYLREDKNLKFSEIAGLTNRSENTVWTEYRNSVNKVSRKLEVEQTEIYVSINIFSNRKLSILESLVNCLKQKGFRNIEIANLLNKDQRVIGTLYSRFNKKINNLSH